eukprot:5828644-Amphidinium_carterae.1
MGGTLPRPRVGQGPSAQQWKVAKRNCVGGHPICAGHTCHSLQYDNMALAPNSAGATRQPKSRGTCTLNEPKSVSLSPLTLSTSFISAIEITATSWQHVVVCFYFARAPSPKDDSTQSPVPLPSSTTFGSSQVPAPLWPQPHWTLVGELKE